MIKLTS